MSETGASPEFERKLQEIGAKSAHMVIPRSEIQPSLAEARYPAWTEDTEQPSPVKGSAAERAMQTIQDALNAYYTGTTDPTTTLNTIAQAAGAYDMERIGEQG